MFTYTLYPTPTHYIYVYTQIHIIQTHIHTYILVYIYIYILWLFHCCLFTLYYCNIYSVLRRAINRTKAHIYVLFMPIHVVYVYTQIKAILLICNSKPGTFISNNSFIIACDYNIYNNYIDYITHIYTHTHTQTHTHTHTHIYIRIQLYAYCIHYCIPIYIYFMRYTY